MNEFIKELLYRNNMKQSELAQILGISAAAVAQWKSMENIKPEILYNLSKLFSIPIDNLLQEQFKDETVQEKCDRLYKIDGYVFEDLIAENDYDGLLDYSNKLKNINERVYNLLYSKITDKIKEEERLELEYLEKYIICNVYRSSYFHEITSFSWNNSDRELKIFQVISEHIDVKEKDSFIWELKKIYTIRERVSWIDLENHLSNEIITQEVITNIFLSYNEFEKSLIVTRISEETDIYNDDMAAFLISLGARVLYTHQDFTMSNYGKEELNLFEGEKKLIPRLNDIKLILDKLHCPINQWECFLCYNDYKKLIYEKKSKRVFYSRFEMTNPKKYWKFIKSEDCYL